MSPMSPALTDPDIEARGRKRGRGSIILPGNHILSPGSLGKVRLVFWSFSHRFWSFLAGFGRAVSEVGAVIIVGGNIDHVTRVMTTSIALETSKGDLPLALALGIILLLISLIINLIANRLKIKINKETYE